MKTKMIIFFISLATLSMSFSAKCQSGCDLWLGHKWPGAYGPYITDGSISDDWRLAIAAAAGLWSNTPGRCFWFITDIASDNLISAGDYGNAGDAYDAFTLPHYGSDMTITGESMTFNTNASISWSTSGDDGYFDVETAALHEFGHWLDFMDDLSNSYSTMFNGYNGGVNRKIGVVSKLVELRS